MEEKKKKLRYTTLQNLRYALSKWWGWDSRGLVQAFSRIPCVVLIPLMGILLPREVINCVTEGAAYGRLAVTLVIFTALLCALHMYDKYIAPGKAFCHRAEKPDELYVSVGGKDFYHGFSKY